MLWLSSFLRVAVCFAADLMPIQHSLREIHELWQWAENEIRQNCAHVNSSWIAWKLVVLLNPKCQSCKKTKFFFTRVITFGYYFVIWVYVWSRNYDIYKTDVQIILLVFYICYVQLFGWKLLFKTSVKQADWIGCRENEWERKRKIIMILELNGRNGVLRTLIASRSSKAHKNGWTIESNQLAHITAW